MKRFVFINMFLLILFFSYSADKSSLNKALIKASEKGDLETVKKLIDKGADINAVSENFGSTPLSRALSGDDTPGKKAVYEFLVKSGADLKIINTNGSSLLHRAAGSGRLYAIEDLVNAGLDINLQNKDGWTPLHSAIFSARTEAVEMIISKSADLNLKTLKGDTPLMYACEDKKCAKIVELLLNAKADFTIKNLIKQTALSKAKYIDFAEAVELLTKAGAIQ